MFGPLLFNGKGDVWSFPGNDLTTQNAPWMKFAFGEISHGNFPLWNPHAFCGTPFFSNFNPGVLYPPHWLCLVLPLATALNVILFINVTLAGWFTALWCRRRGLSAVASLVGGTIYMYSGAYFHHQFPGHEAPLASMAWTPLVFLAIEGIFDDLHWKWALLGMLAVAMQILAGFPQAVYYTGLIGGLYSLLRLFGYSQRRAALLRLVVLYAGATLIAAVQLLPGLQTAGESVRQGGSDYEFAAQCPLPPENFLQLLAGSPLGDGVPSHSPYIGIWYPWEVSLFCGITTLILAGYGAVHGSSGRRQFACTLLIVSTVLALGVNLKWVFDFAYYCIPLFNSFRTVARFNWFMTLYIAMLAGIGFDVLVAGRTSWRPLITVAVAAACVSLIGCAIWFSSSTGLETQWGRFVRDLATSKDNIHLAGPVELNDAFASKTGAYAADQFWVSALTLVVMGGALALLRISPRMSILLAAVTVAELFIFANRLLVSGPLNVPVPNEWLNATVLDTRQYRELHPYPYMQFANLGMVDNYNEICGYDPVSLKRYADFVCVAQDVSLDDPKFKNFMPPIQVLMHHPNLFRLLRCKYVFGVTNSVDAQGHPAPAVLPFGNPMPQLQLLQGYTVASDEYQIAASLQSPNFNPRKTVILESNPEPAPTQNPRAVAPGTASVVAYSTDWMEITADLPEPAILLVTDSYSKYWHARPIDAGPQTTYNVMPADLTLRAIPLAAGRHHFLLEYAPSGYKIGKWISIVSLLAWIVLVFRYRGPRGQYMPKAPDGGVFVPVSTVPAA
jgi:hypothetical protein